MRVCNVCKVLTDQFHSKSRTCKPCANERTRLWKIANPERAKANDRRKKLAKRYGMTMADVEALRLKQGGKCAICCTAEIDGQTFNVDHNHSTGAVRGLLCKYCNLSLGWYENHGTRAVAYLTAPPAAALD